MADEESELIRDIAETRDHLEKKLETLETRLRRSVDVRDRIRRRPWVAVSGAATAGFALGLLRRSSRPRAGDGVLREVALIVMSGLVRDFIHAAAPQLAASVTERLRTATGSRPRAERAPAGSSARVPAPHDSSSPQPDHSSSPQSDLQPNVS